MRIYVLIFLLCFLTYNLNLSLFYPQIEGDTTPAALLPANIVGGHGFYFDQYKASTYPNYDPYFFQKIGQHYFSTFPLVSGILAIPFLVINNTFAAEKLAASFFTALSVLFFFHLFYLICRKVKISLVFSLIFAFATGSFSTTSQHLWTQVAGNLFLITSQIFLVRGLGESKRRTRHYLFSLFFAALAMFARFTIISYLLIIFLLATALDYKKILYYLAVTMLGIGGLLLYNMYFYGSLLGGYGYFLKYFNGALHFKINDLPGNLLGVLISPARGIIIYSSLFIYTYLAPLFWQRIKTLKGQERLLIGVNFIFLCGITVNAALYPQWWSGYSYGSRFVTEAIPSAIIIAFFIFNFLKSQIAKTVFLVVVVWSVFVQIIGFIYYPKEKYNDYPNNIDWNAQRLWEISDNPLQRALVVGSELSGYFVLKDLIEGKQSRPYDLTEINCKLQKIQERTLLGYRLLGIKLENRSKVEWITRSFLKYNDIEVVANFTNLRNGKVYFSHIPVLNFPGRIKKDQIINFESLIIPPDNDSYRLFLYITQPQGQGFVFCGLEFPL